MGEPMTEAARAAAMEAVDAVLEWREAARHTDDDDVLRGDWPESDYRSIVKGVVLAVLPHLDWHELGKRVTPEQLTTLLRGAEEVRMPDGCGPTVTAGRMTKAEARERLAFYATFSDAVDQIVHAHDALAVLLDPETMLRAWEKAGRVEKFEVWESFCDHEAQITGRRKKGDAWRIVPDEEEANSEES